MGVIIRRQYNSPKWELFRGIVQEAIVLGANLSGGNYPEGNCPRQELSRGQLLWSSCLEGIVWGQFSRERIFLEPRKTS